MKFKWNNICHGAYKFIDINFLNTTICVLVGLLVNTYTASTFNTGYNWSIGLFFVAICLTLVLIYTQGYLRRSVDKFIVKNQTLPAADRKTGLEEIELHTIEFNGFRASLVPILTFIILVIMGASVMSYHYGSTIGNPIKERQNKHAQNELDSIITICINERDQLSKLQEMIAKQQTLSGKALDTVKATATHPSKIPKGARKRTRHP